MFISCIIKLTIFTINKMHITNYMTVYYNQWRKKHYASNLEKIKCAYCDLTLMTCDIHYCKCDTFYCASHRMTLCPKDKKKFTRNYTYGNIIKKHSIKYTLVSHLSDEFGFCLNSDNMVKIYDQEDLYKIKSIMLKYRMNCLHMDDNIKEEIAPIRTNIDINDIECDNCDTTTNLYICLKCINVGCSGERIKNESGKCAIKHYRRYDHCIIYDVSAGKIYCYKCNSYINGDERMYTIICNDILNADNNIEERGF
ncbi:UBP-type zinc finger protein [Spraguea lophii 42_110]|uniref:UBP-type zinc finger protein n=1 Tax=Spraguea lophii (strain 42_110) TaxID=1358809 RepID=S7XI34_SPRLO|nr:UBP-type zinc finger protein [Spraguea lophii 42_110]